MTRQPIGNLNGHWATLLRFCLATYPLLIGWAGWVTVEQVKDSEFRKMGPRLTPAMQAAKDEAHAVAILSEASRMLQSHANLPGHAVMVERVDDVLSELRTADETQREQTRLIRNILELLQTHGGRQ